VAVPRADPPQPQPFSSTCSLGSSRALRVMPRDSSRWTSTSHSVPWPVRAHCVTHAHRLTG
jgi:hypothetical protein